MVTRSESSSDAEVVVIAAHAIGDGGEEGVVERAASGVGGGPQVRRARRRTRPSRRDRPRARITDDRGAVAGSSSRTTDRVPRNASATKRVGSTMAVVDNRAP